MLRSCLCAVVALTLCVGLTRAEDKKKKGTTATGTIKKIDTEKGVLTVAVKVKKETQDKDFSVADAKVVVYTGEDKKELSSKDGLKNEAVKEGVKVAILSDADGKVTEVRINPPKEKKGNTAAGTIKKIDKEKNVLTVTVKVKKEMVDKDFPLTDATKFVVYTGEDKKELTSKDGLKNEEVKEGAKVAIVSDKDGKVTQVSVNQPKKKKNK